LTSIRRVAPGGITSPAPTSPYAYDGGIINFLSSPSHILILTKKEFLNIFI
jgi:hypothetical protein